MTRRFASRRRALLLNVIATALVLIFSAAPSAAGTVTLTWAANPEPDLAGYEVFYGTTSGIYAGSVNVGNVTSFEFAAPDPSVRYYFAVSAYNEAGLRSELSTEVYTDAEPTLTLTGMTASLPSPQAAGTSITFTAETTGTEAQFKWLVSDGTTWTTAQDWSSSNVFTWTPSVANSNYTVGVWARPATSTMDAPDPSLSAYKPFAIVNPPTVTPIVLTSLTTRESAPQLVGSRIQFTASANGANAYEFKWWVSDGVTWTVTQDWSRSNKFTWVPATANPNYQVLVRVRNAADPSQSDGAAMPFAIVAASDNGSANGKGSGSGNGNGNGKGNK